MTDTAVVVPTFRRPESLLRAIRSLFAQAGVETRLREIVVVDNDPEGSAAVALATLRAEAPLPLVAVHEPRPGVATARNAGLAMTTAPLIAFLDDDETASPGWLAALITTLERFEADAVFGPIRTVLPDQALNHRAYLERFFARTGPDASGPLAQAYGCGNSLLRRAAALPGAAPFETGCDETGGEDDALFQDLIARGGKLAWAADALAWEHPPAERATLAYALARAFAYGQGPSQACARAGDWAGVAKWMAVGAAQAAVNSALVAPALAFNRPDRADRLDRTVRGLGKLAWMRGLEPRFYGRAGLARGGRARSAVPAAAAH
jgi:hypothetical protein